MDRCGIPFESIADYFEGRAEGDAAARIREHLEAGCRTCQENLAWLESTTTTLQEATGVNVPQPLLDRAYALFRERFRVPDLPSLFAFLQFDGRTLPALALSGARSRTQERFELIYSNDEYDVDLFQEPAEDGTWHLIGQVLPKKDDAEIIPQEIVMTAADGNTTAVTPTAEEFYLSSVPAGTYEMRLRLADAEIVVSELIVGR